MNTLTIFIIEIFISFIISGTTLWALNNPLKNVLEDLCPTKIRAEFWAAYTRIMLCVAPLLLVVLFSNTSKYVLMSPNAAIAVIKSTMIAALAGLLFGLIMIGRKVFASINITGSNQ